MASILEKVEEAARAAGAERVTCIRLVVGDMTEVAVEALEFALEALGLGTLSEGANLVVERVKPRSRCMSCGFEFEHDRFHRFCPACDALATELLAGRELFIKDVEVKHASEATRAGEPEASCATRAGEPEASCTARATTAPQASGAAGVPR